MKPILIFLLLIPHALWAQKIKTNEYDKFIQQQRVESFPLPLVDNAKAKTSIAFSATGPNYYVQISGSGMGTNIISDEDKVIFLLDNDSTITARSTGVQTYDVSKIPSTYRHDYSLSMSDLEVLSRHSVQAIRKYYQVRYFDDIYIPKPATSKIKSLTSLFVQQLKSGNIFTVRTIDLKDLSKHIGDSIAVVGRVSGGKFLSDVKDEPTLLNIGAAFPNQFLTVVIPGVVRPLFEGAPEKDFDRKEIRVAGKVEMYKGKPQIVVYKKEQLLLSNDSSLMVKAPVTNNRPAAPIKKAATKNRADTTTAKAVASRPPASAPVTKSVPVVRKVAPAFPGGLEAWTDFLKRNIQAGANVNYEGKAVVVQFTVSSDGAISNIAVKQGLDATTDAEVLRVLKRMPKWKPAVEGGRSVNSTVSQTISFSGSGLAVQ